MRVQAKPQVTLPDPALQGGAASHFEHKLSFETDPADVHHDVSEGVATFVIVDARAREAWKACRVPGAIHLPHQRIGRETTRDLDPGTLIVTYCWGPGCNAATKAASRFAALGFPVREMIGGLEYWRREGYPVEGSQGDEAPLVGS